MSNEHTQILRLLCAIWPPHRCQKNMMSDNLSRVSGQVDQKIELLGRQMYLSFLNFNLARWNVDAEISNLDHRSLWLELEGRPTQSGPDAGQQFVYSERFCDVIVGACIECFHFDRLLAFY